MKRSEKKRYYGDLAARTVAAIGGGYLMTAVVTTAIAMLLPMSRADATTISTMLSFLLYACAIIWMFAVRSAAYAWIGISCATGVPAALLWLYRSV